MTEEKRRVIPYVLEIEEEHREIRKGWCISCGWNKGPCLPGGTINWGSGATCTSPIRLERDKEDYDLEEGEEYTYTLYYRMETIYPEGEDECDEWKRGYETPLQYGVKQVDKDKSNHCPHCEKTMEPHEGSSCAHLDRVVTVTCAFCEMTYFYLEPEEDGS